MLKKIFLTLLAIVVLSNGSLAKSNNETNTNNSNELKPEPYFDLPKKDAKEQCEEVERVVDSIETQNGSIYDGPGTYNYFDKNKEKYFAYNYDSFVLKNENGKYLNKSFILIYDVYNKKYLAMPDLYYSRKLYEESGFLYQKTNHEDYFLTKTQPKNFRTLIKFSGCLIEKIYFNY